MSILLLGCRHHEVKFFKVRILLILFAQDINKHFMMNASVSFKVLNRDAYLNASKLDIQINCQFKNIIIF